MWRQVLEKSPKVRTGHWNQETSILLTSSQLIPDRTCPSLVRLLTNNHDNPNSIIFERLDRGLSNNQWKLNHPNAIISHPPRLAYDHYLLPLTCDQPHSKPPKRFVLDKYLLDSPKIQGLVNNVWKKHFRGSPTFLLSKRMFTLSRSIVAWVNNNLGNINVAICNYFQLLKPLPHFPLTRIFRSRSIPTPTLTFQFPRPFGL